MASPPDLTVISLGGGVQSSVMALMAGEGAFERPPDCAIFADTHWEPPSIYTHLDWLSRNMSFPLYMVDNGRSLREDAKALTNHSGNPSFVDLPVYLKGRNGEGDGIGRRQCTQHYKIAPVRRKIRELLGLRKGQRVLSHTAVELWLGISTDQAVRMKDSRDRWITNRFPLIDAGMPRGIASTGGRPATTGRWNARPASPAPSSHASDGCRPSAGGRSCSLRRWRSTRTCAAGSPSPRSHTSILEGYPLTRPSTAMKHTWDTMGKVTGSETSARDTVGCENRGPTLL